MEPTYIIMAVIVASLLLLNVLVLVQVMREQRAKQRAAHTAAGQSSDEATIPPVSPEVWEARHREFIADGWKEEAPGLYTKPARPSAVAPRDNPAFKGLMEAVKIRDGGRA